MALGGGGAEAGVLGVRTGLLFLGVGIVNSSLELFGSGATGAWLGV